MDQRSNSRPGLPVTTAQVDRLFSEIEAVEQENAQDQEKTKRDIARHIVDEQLAGTADPANVLRSANLTLEDIKPEIASYHEFLRLATIASRREQVEARMAEIQSRIDAAVRQQREAEMELKDAQQHVHSTTVILNNANSEMVTIDDRELSPVKDAEIKLTKPAMVVWQSPERQAELRRYQAENDAIIEAANRMWVARQELAKIERQRDELLAMITQLKQTAKRLQRHASSGTGDEAKKSKKDHELLTVKIAEVQNHVRLVEVDIERMADEKRDAELAHAELEEGGSIGAPAY